MSCEEEIEVVEIKACESLDRFKEFKEFYPDFNSINKILTRYPINSGGENNFVHQFANDLEGGSREARQIYRTAADISEKAALIWANIKDAIAPYYSQVIFNNLPDSFLSKLRSIPAYDRLFGSLDYINCDHCRSIFGPAAYFADLMKFVQTYITDITDEDGLKKNKIPALCALEDRRPDFGKIRLDCSNSTDMIASIDLVNELLQAFLQTTGNYADAYKLAKDAIFPQSLPFNSPREEMQSYLQIYETSLWQIYQAFNRPFVDTLFENKIEGQIAREFLQLSPEDFRLITSEISSLDISGYYGGVDLTGIDGLENVDVLLEQTKLTREELNELVSQNLDRHEINAGLSRLFFVNSADDGLGTLALSSEESVGYDKLHNLSPAKLDRMYRFLKLSRKLNWSFTDLDWSLRSLCQPYLPERALKFDGIDDYVSCRNADKLDLFSLPEFTIEAWVSPDSAANNAVLGLLINRTPEQHLLYLGVNPSGKLEFYIFRISSGPDGKAERKKIFEIESYYDSIASGIFTHVAVSYANGKFCLFINGKKVLINKENDSEKPFIKPAISNSPLLCVDMSLGRDLFDNYFHGIIKEVRIWQKARDETALQENRYQRFTGRERDLIGYWPLIEGLWDYLPDMTPQGSHGVLGGGEFSAQPKWIYRELILDPLPEAKGGSLLRFNGQDQYLAARGFKLADADQITIEAQVNVEVRPGVARRDDYILCLGEDGQNAKVALYSSAQGKLVFRLCPEPEPDYNPIILTSIASLPQGENTHVCVTLNKNVVKFYINGIESNIITTQDVNIDVVNGFLNVGRSFDGENGGNYFIGMIKELRIWSQARTDAEINSYLYRKVPPSSEGLVGYWKLDEVAEGKVADLTGNEIDLYLGGILDDYSPSFSTTEIFNGQDQYLAARGFKLADTGQITIEAQVKVEERSGVARRDDYILCLGEDGQNAKVALYSSAQGKLVFKLCPEPEPDYNPIILTSSASLPLGKNTHVCVTLNKNTVKFYINGIERSIISTQDVNIDVVNGFLNVGRSFDGENGGNYFIGMIKELRIWSRARTDAEINSYLYRKVPPSSEGLVGYWRLDEVAEGKVADLTGNEFDLCLDGILDDYSPFFSATEILPRLEDLPVLSAGTVLQFDGDNDVIVIKNPENRGLGRYERLTIELWFNASAHGDARRKQVLFTQGDAEAGLCIYLYNGWLYILEWNNSLENIAQNIAPQSKSLFKSSSFEYGKWHHIAVTQNEFPHPIPEKVAYPVDNCFYREDNLELRAYLDAVPLLNASGNTDVCTGYKLCPVGPIYLGGLGRNAKTCFDDAYSDRNNIYFFAGQIANLGIWNLVKSVDTINYGRYFAPSITKDLITYLPLDEGEGWCVRGWVEKNRHIGTLQDRNIGLVCKQFDAELINIYSHYFSGPGALSWSDYCFSGRMQIKERNASIGVTFYSRHIEDIDQCYLLGRDANQKTFHLFAHPSGVQKIKSSNPGVDLRDTGIDPQLNVWYHFLIRVETTATQINIKAKVWPENEAMPDAFQIDAYDDSGIRINSGTVGLWTTGAVASQRQFDNLRVWPLNISDPLPTDLLLDINFEAESQMPEPDLWLDGEDRQKLALPGGLFKQINVLGGTAGETAFGTDSEDINIHSYFIPVGSDELSWNNYQFQGRMRISNIDSGIGVIFFSRQPEGIDQYYGLARDAQHRTFHLIAHPQDVQKVESFDPLIDRRDSGINPQPNVWYNFLLEVYDTGSATRIRAKIWPESQIASSVYVIDAIDDSDIRIKSGAMGVWASGTGSKYFRYLKVYRNFIINENFDSYSAGQDPLNWRDTQANNSNVEDNSLFKTYDLDGRMVFGTVSQAVNIHTHYVGGDARNWKNYIFTGCLLIGNPSFGSIGVTVLSQYFSGQSSFNKYYKLINSPVRGFEILNASNAPLVGTYISHLIPLANTWYRFLIVVEDTGSRTNVKAKIWPESGTEPSNYQINAYDASLTRQKTGTVGFLATNSGSKYFKDLSVFTSQQPLDSTIPENWHDLTQRTSIRGTSVDYLFKTVDLLDNTPHWVALPGNDNSYYYPVLLRPLSLTSLDFDGKQMYLAGIGCGDVTIGQFALEAWICPSLIKESSIISIAGKDSDEKDIILAFGMDGSGYLKLSQKQGDVTTVLATSLGAVLEISKFSHVALSTKNNSLAFFINGAEVVSNVNTLGLLNSAGLHIARADIGRGIGDDYFSGRIKDVRIWDIQRSLQDILLSRYQKAAPSDHLMAYWSLGEEEGGLVSDLSDNGNQMRKGGLAEDRCPTLIDVALLGFWRPQRRALNFNDTSHVINKEYDRANEVVNRCTIEVWFRVEDKTISRQKQVIYQEGDDQCGLAVYVYDSSLYLGGYNLLCGWQGTWLHSDRIESGRWHHAAIVLDGRAEVRDESLQVYLDGKLMDCGPASQIKGANVSFSLGGLHSPIRFHDSLYEGGSGHLLCGQILCLRMWNSARTGVQISSNLYSEPESAGRELMQKANLVRWELNHSDYTWEPVLCREIMRFREIPEEELPGLDLWWESDVVDPSARIILDQSDKVHNGAYAVGQLQSIPLPAKYELPWVSLDEKAKTLEGIAAIKLLMERSSLANDRLTALWYVLKHVGNDGDSPLFDRIFNPEGTVVEPWDYYLDEPMRWDKSGRDKRDNSIRSRLMGAMRLSDSDLNLIVEYLSGKDEVIIELDHKYLGRLYQLSQLARMLSLGVADLLNLLSMFGGQPDSLPEILKISNVAEWLNTSGLSVSDLVYFACPVIDPKSANDSLYSFEDIRSLADSIFRQSASFVVTGKTFQSDLISEDLSSDIFTFLSGQGIVTSIGTVSQTYHYELELSDDLLIELAEIENWMSEFEVLKAEFDDISPDLGIGNEILGRLQSHGFINQFGLVLENTDSLMTIFDGQEPSQAIKDKLPRVTEILEQRKAFQVLLLDIDGPIRTALKGSQESLNSIFQSGLAGLFDAKMELILPIVEYLGSEGGQYFDQHLIDLNALLPPGSELSAGLEIYLFKISKLIRLAGAFELTAEEMSLLLSYPERFSVSDLLQPSLSDLNNLYNYKQLQSALNDTEGLLDKLLALPSHDRAAINEALDELAGWEPEQMAALVKKLEASNYNTIAGICRLKECFDIATTLKTAIYLLIQLSDTDVLKLQEEYDFYTQKAAELLEVLRAAYSEEEWPDIIKPIHDHLAVLRRDALLALALQKLPEYWEEYIFCWDDAINAATEAPDQDNDPLRIFLGRTLQMDFVEKTDVIIEEANRKLRLGPVNGRNVTIAITGDATANEDGTALLTSSDGLSLELITKLESTKINEIIVTKINVYRQNRFRKGPDIYHEYFLMDMQVGAEMETSRIVQATAALQFYIQRCLMNLEAGVNPSTIPLPEWEWVKNYRVWEANRKVFLYPENYIEPELRDTKTPFFEDLEQELMQSDISQESVEAAYVHYLEKFAEVANLKIVGSYLHVDVVDKDHPEVLYLVGKTRFDPGTFYLRERIKDKSGERWLPWAKIDMSINSDFVTPVYAFGKLFLFWTEFTKIKKGEEGSSSTIEVYNTAIKYSYFNFSQEWKPPQSWKELDNELSEEEHNKAKWQRIYAQRIVNLSLPENVSAEDVEENAKVLQIDHETFIEKIIPEFDMSTITWEFWVRFENENPAGWPGSVTKEDCTRSALLLDYNYGSFRADAANNVIEIPGYQAKVNDANYVAGKTATALELINNANYSAGAIYEEQARAKADIAAFDDHVLVAQKALDAKNAALDAVQKRLDASIARNAANSAKSYYESLGDSDPNKQAALEEWGRLEGIAVNLETEAGLAESVAQQKAAVANIAANTALNAELAKPKWESKDVSISLTLFNKIIEPLQGADPRIKIDFGFWNHIAIVQKSNNQFGIYKNGQKVFDLNPNNNTLLAKEGTLLIGSQEEDVADFFLVQMSEMRLWDRERSIEEINEFKETRMEGAQGLFCLPFNKDMPDCIMSLISSPGFNFTLMPWNEVLQRIAEKERLILFFGDQIASLRNNLKDKSFILRLEPSWRQVVLDVNLSFDANNAGSSKAILHLTETKGLSINDFATSDEELVARPTTLTSTFNNQNILLKNLEGTECAFSDVNNQPGWYVVNAGDEELLVRAFITKLGEVIPLRIPTTAEIMKVEYGQAPAIGGLPQDLVVSFELENDNPLLATTALIKTRYLGYRRRVSLAISNNDNRIICADEPGRLSSLTEVNMISNNMKVINLSGRSYSEVTTAIALTADATQAATIRSSPWRTELILWDCKSGLKTKTMGRAALMDDHLLAVSHNAGIAISASNHRLTVWHLGGPSEGQINQLDGNTDSFSALAITPDGLKAVSASEDGTIKVWDLENEVLLMTLSGHIYEGGDALAISDDGKRAVSVESGKKLNVWNLESGTVLHSDIGGQTGRHTDIITSLDIFRTKDGLMVVSGSRDKTVKVWNIDQGTLLRTLTGHSQTVNAVVARGGLVASVSDDGTLKVWSISETPESPKTIEFAFERLNTFAVHELSEGLFTGGIDGLLSISSQMTEELDFWKIYEPNTTLVPQRLTSIKSPSTIDFQGTYSLYFEEVFFHIPFFIANKLNSNQSFEEAQRWYHYIFNPTANDEAAGDGSGKDRYWRYLPFRQDRFTSLKTLLTYSTALAAYREDPFDPHAIAALRLTAYKKAVVMKYIDNLLDWGDALFMQDSRESINEAVGAYVLAFNLLGPRPKVKTIKRFEEIGTYEDFIKDYKEASEFMTEVEKIATGGGSPVLSPHRNIITDFCVPENGKFIGYWDLVEDRLFKIRHSQNFEGVYRQLALFSPPIDPMDLVAAVALGGGISGALSSLNVSVPHYRYPIVVGLAKEMAGNAISLGSSLLDAIEKRDAEKLANLQNTQERTILNMMTSIKEEEIEEVEKEIEALTVSKTSAESKRDRYINLISVGNLYGEDLEIVYKYISAGLRGGQALFKLAKGIASVMPAGHTGGAGVGGSPVAAVSLGPKQYAALFESGGDILECLSEEMDHAGEAAGKTAEYERRDEEWEFEKGQADYEAKEIQVQIDKANISLLSANKELAIHQRNIDQNKEIEDFYRSKFSNESLYNWMVGRLSALYFQSYKTAYDMAKSAEKCLQYDIPSTSTYITPTHWDSLRKGLLAGEALLLQLDQMEKSHLAQDSRFIEIEKTISMNNTYKGALTLLQFKGACEFKLNEEIFDKDYPGHYFRVIKTIELTIVTQRDLAWYPELEEYKPVNVTLIQLGNKTLLKPDLNGVKYLMGRDDGSEEFVRVNWRANQQVAVSKVNLRDAGMFYMDFIFDNRYFPFEGTGLVSSWRLEIPHASNPDLLNGSSLDISDVLITIRYTAKSERGRFKTEVENLLRSA